MICGVHCTTRETVVMFKKPDGMLYDVIVYTVSEVARRYQSLLATVDKFEKYNNTLDF